MSEQKIKNTEPKENAKPLCFVMMPISDGQNYDPGHFNRVYEHLFKPAIEAAGFNYERADDITKTDYIVVSIVKKIIDAEMVLCDMSSRNPNVLYELGLRHAYQKKVVLVKDTKTEKIFDVQGLRYTEYDGTLRVDTVQKDIIKIKESLEKTYSDKDSSINSIVQLSGIVAATPPEQKKVSADTAMLLNAIEGLRNQVSVLMPGYPKYFSRIGTDAIKVSDGRINKGNEIFVGGEIYGTLKEVHVSQDRCLVMKPDGSKVEISAHDPAAKNWSSFPF